MFNWLIRKLGGVPMSDIQAVVVSPEELAAANPVQDPTPAVEPAPEIIPDEPATETDFDKVKRLVAKVEAGIEEAFDDALGIATDLGGNVEGHLKDFLKEAGYALPAFDKIVSFAKKHL